MATTIDAGPFREGGLITGNIDLADFPSGTPQLDFTDDSGQNVFDITIDGTRWSASIPSDMTTGLKTDVQLSDGIDTPVALNDFTIAAAGGGQAARDLASGLAMGLGFD